MIDIKDLLMAWGQWSRTGADIAGIGHKPLSIYRGNGSYESSYEFDSKMLEIDKAMTWLKDKSQFDYSLLKLKYQHGFSNVKLCKQLQTYDSKLKVMLDLAEDTLAKRMDNT